MKHASEKELEEKGKIDSRLMLLLGVIFVCGGLYFIQQCFATVTYDKDTQPVSAKVAAVAAPAPVIPVLPPLDTAKYDAKLTEIANGDISGLWPVKRAYPDPGAILPFSRIVAYYGNFYSTKMGVLGEYPEPVMLAMLAAEVKKWQVADPTTPVIPAIHYIAVTAQGSPGADGKYRARMPDSQIEIALGMAAKINGLVFLDVQTGQSTVESEIPALGKYLMMPQVNLGIDPEFSMKTGKKPGTVIGTMDASDINYVIGYLSQLVKDNHLPPKILVVHRFTEGMVTNYQLIAPTPEVQVVMDMDGWGAQPQKLKAYSDFISKEPVEFTGFKLFYKNDVLTPGSTMLTPNQLLKLVPQPMYIQYQ